MKNCYKFFNDFYYEEKLPTLFKRDHWQLLKNREKTIQKWKMTN